MTPTQRNELARMAGAEIICTGHYYFTTYVATKRYVFPSVGAVVPYLWHPETSRDDCQPLLEEITRRGLWKEFRQHLFEIRPHTWNDYTNIWDVVHWYMTMIQPADIVAAFRKTIEEANRKGDE